MSIFAGKMARAQFLIGTTERSCRAQGQKKKGGVQSQDVMLRTAVMDIV
jgi:hypothetical protein